jgi:signal peptidase II
VTTRNTQLVWIVGVFCLVIAADQATKAAICQKWPDPQRSPSFAGREETFFFLTHQRNPGLVGGMFRNTRGVAFVAPIIATVVLVYLYRHLDPRSKLQRLAYGLVAGGAIGNLIDRLCRGGEVVDFLQFHFYFIPFEFPWKQYPAFNIADSAICTGVFLLILSWRKTPVPEQRDAADPA